MTVDSSKNGAALYCLYELLSGNLEHVTIQLNAYHCMLFSSRVMVRIRSSVWFVSGYSHVFMLLSVVIVVDWRHC